MPAGQALQRLLLLLGVQLGLRASYLNQPVQVAALRPKLQQLTGRPGYAQLLLRIGTPTQVKPAAPRRPLADVLVSSAGTPKPFLDERGQPLAGSMSEKIRVDINGIEQGMFIKGRNAGNPVLPYLHGGVPDHLLQDRYPTDLEDIVTVIRWEQRGSGLSYHPDMARGP